MKINNKFRKRFYEKNVTFCNVSQNKFVFLFEYTIGRYRVLNHKIKKKILFPITRHGVEKSSVVRSVLALDVSTTIRQVNSCRGKDARISRVRCC